MGRLKAVKHKNYLTMKNTVTDSLLGLDNDSLLAGLEAQLGVALNPQQRKVATGLANAKVKRAMQQNLLTRAQKYVISKSEDLDEETKAQIAKGGKQFFATSFYMRRLITAVENLEILGSNTDYVRGVRNFAGAALSDTESVIIHALKIGYGWDATETEPGNIHYTNAYDAETSTGQRIPAGFLNGEVVFQANEKVVYRGPVRDFFRDSLATGVKVPGKDDVVHIKPFILKPKQKVKVEYYGAKNAADTSVIAFPAGNHFAEFSFFVETFISK